MDRPKRKSKWGAVAVAVAVACLPDDALVEILSRLPAKPLFRFKCVSKAWRDLIADRLHRQKFPQTLEGFFTSDGEDVYEHSGDFIDLAGRPVPLVDPSFSFLKLPWVEKIVLLDSCNGLVLFGRRRRYGVWHKLNSLGYIVCNPATEQWVFVPRSGWTPWIDNYRRDEQDQDHVILENVPVTRLIFDPAVSPHFQLVQLCSSSCLGGCMGDDSMLTELSIWVLEDYIAGKWVLRDNVSFSQLFGRMRRPFPLGLECGHHSSGS